MSRDGRNRRHRPARNTALRAWGSSHLRCLVEALGRMHRRWLASLLTTMVIGITLALPTGLYVLVENLDGLTDNWQTGVAISLYLSSSVDDTAGRKLADHIARDDDVIKTRYISPDEGLAAFKQHTGLGHALDALTDNPLPPVIVVTPAPSLSSDGVDALRQQLQQHDNVDSARLDQAWLHRLHAIIALLERSAWVIGVLLAIAVLFIVGNTIRLDIENRREEIEVMKLIGASDAFIRRPFLYSGAWYGFFGALFALLLLGISFLALARPLHELMQSYAGALQLSGLGWPGVGWLVAGSILLGWLGCAITVNRRLRTIEPG